MRPWLFMLLLTSLPAFGRENSGLETVSLRVGKSILTVELAVSPQQRERGLMFRRSMAQEHGMLFVFPHDQLLSFYMKNTLIPLSIAYINHAGIIQEIHPMEPQQLRTIDSSWPMRYALEVNRGWFERHNIKIGDRIELPQLLQKNN